MKEMKKIFVMLFSVLAVSFGTVSCSDSETDPGDKKVEPTDSTKEDKDTLASDSADYTVIFWGMAGKLDPSVVMDLNTVIKNYREERIGKNVNFAGLLKTSMGFYRYGQSEPLPEDSDSTWYFDSSNIGPDSLENPGVWASSEKLYRAYQSTFKALRAKVYADRKYPMSDADSLAAFIKKTAEAFPARHYVLLLSGHGTGFRPDLEDPYISSRGCVIDNYDKDDEAGLITTRLVQAVERSGVKIQTLFTECCLMGALENMAAYSRVFDYAFLSAEPVSPFYYPEYLVYLSQAGADEEKMKKASRDLVDYYRKFYDGEVKAVLTSYGFYDLTKTSQLLDVVKEATDWYIGNYDDADLQKKINYALANAVFCKEIGDGIVAAKCQKVRKYVLAKLQGQKVPYSREELVDLFTEWTGLIKQTTSSSVQGYCMSDVLRQTLAVLPQEKKASLQDIYDRYIKALKDMAYIRANAVPAKADTDYPYIYASPTVNVFSMLSEYQHGLANEMNDEVMKMIDAMVNGDDDTANELYRKLFGGSLTITYGLSSPERLEITYSAADFCQKTGWTNFLKKLTFNPDYYINPDRNMVNEGME